MDNNKLIADKFYVSFKYILYILYITLFMFPDTIWVEIGNTTSVIALFMYINVELFLLELHSSKHNNMSNKLLCMERVHQLAS